ncbi:BolA family transcriptional regulator [Paracoccus yeei]|uniref:BolA family transcriptional regulator n=2 Tax=Paracoccus TaxID=265 RepID=A0A1V0GQ25_9RHOB|nr:MULTISPECIES: BolA family protein [Paracoccus]ARC35910.1 BolA family transcriptional regulator [Paracoccus yeei]ATQ54487.1 BolA family transcriptional regulator [Paracoccus yeei]AWX92594.1 BolA family transcriptional regulator [Paracoccus mutanolyticus]AYF01827.1 BolA family transcriptional regulator [Paracoccus yeei]OWJ91019.1 BolA family transcriptional regulator [Paracoccus yeei]
MIVDEMTARLQALHPTRLEILDESESHRGHGGWREGGETHFRIRMASPAFVGLDRVARHRLVHRTLGDIVPRIHALAMELAER